MDITRRRFLSALAAGGTVIAGQLWVPGQTVISIPSGRRFQPDGWSRLKLFGVDFGGRDISETVVIPGWHGVETSHRFKEIKFITSLNEKAQPYPLTAGVIRSGEFRNSFAYLALPQRQAVVSLDAMT